MGPARKSRSVNRKHVNEISPSKEGDTSKRSSSRKRKPSDLLGPRWTMDELTRFYDAYRKFSKDWKKVSGAVRNRSSEMVEALYSMNRAYLSLPHGTASAAGLIAMMTDHYSNMAGSDSERNSDDGAGSSRKSQKHFHGKLQPATSKASDEQYVSHSQIITSNYGCLPLLTKKRSRGSRPCPVGKRTPRFPVSFTSESNGGERYFSPTRKGPQRKANANDDEVAHEIAMALTEASQRGGSPQISQAPSKRAESVMPSPFQHAQKKHSVAEMANAKHLDSDKDEEDLEGSTEADAGELSRYKSVMVESLSIGAVRQRGRKLEGNKSEVENNGDNQLNDIKEECSGTDGATRSKLNIEVNNDKVLRPSMQSQRKKTKKVPFKRDENPAFDALQTLADLSLMMPSENEDELRMQFKDENDDHVDESVALEAPPINLPKGKRRHSEVRMKGHQPASSSQIASSKTMKPGKGAVSDSGPVPEVNADLLKLTTKTRKKQKMQVSKIQKTEVHPDIHLSEYPAVETTDAGKKLMTKSKKSTQSGSPNLMKNSENSSSADLRKEGSDSAQSAAQVPAVNDFNLPSEVRSRRKMNLKKPQVLNDLKFPDKDLNDHSNVPMSSLNGRACNLKEKLSSCLKNPHLRRWCTYEWFYSAVDYPWFAKREFVEYLCHVGLGHVSNLTRAEWGVIRSSLGKPRRFSKQFLKEEKEKLNQYRDSVRKHYTELRDGVREGLPTDLARPLSVGQRVIAIHPKTRGIHDGSVLTVDHSRCHVQFDRPELGVEFVMDIDCMPMNPYENMPTFLWRQTIAVDKFFENLNELKINGQTHEFIKLCPGDNVDSIDSIFQSSPIATNLARPIKQAKVASANTDVQLGIVPSSENASYLQSPYSQPSTGVQVHPKEADVQALTELTRALEKKEAVVMELRRMNNDVLENQKDGDSSLKDCEQFRKQYAAVLVQLSEVNEQAQVSSALCCLRQRNTYPGNFLLACPRAVINLADPGGELSSFDHSACQTLESESHANEIIESSRTKAWAMVDAAIQALSSLKGRDDTNEKIEETIDYLNDQLPSDDSSNPMPHDHKSMNVPDMEAQIPSELISKCVATLLMIQKCTERQFPPSDMAQILDSAVTSLQPRSSQNLPVYNEIQKCMGIIRNQIMARIPT